MSRVRGTRTERNLLAAFAGESQARNRYEFYAKQARKDGLIQISAIFAETAEQERSHAKSFLKRLGGGSVEITASYPASPPGTTADNLRAAADGELEEHERLYPEFARVAREEGFDVIAALFAAVSVAERYHEQRFRRLLANLEAGRVFEREEPVVWRCRKCGFTHEGPQAPRACAACAHPRAYFELVDDNF